MICFIAEVNLAFHEVHCTRAWLCARSLGHGMETSVQKSEQGALEMLISQPINGWGPQPIKSYCVIGAFWAGREVIKWGFYYTVMELEREKHGFQSRGEKSSKSSEKTWRRRMSSGDLERRLPGCCSKASAWRLESLAGQKAEKWFTTLESLSGFLLQSVPEDQVPTTCWDTKSFEFGQMSVCIAKDLEQH